jgi:hypothetical protein
MSDTSQGPGWYLASDGKWYPPQGEAWYQASDGKWYPPDGPLSAPTAAYAPLEAPVTPKRRRGWLYGALGVVGVVVLLTIGVAIAGPAKKSSQHGPVLAPAGVAVTTSAPVSTTIPVAPPPLPTTLPAPPVTRPPTTRAPAPAIIVPAPPITHAPPPPAPAPTTPPAAPQPPMGATARCNDGSYSFAAHHQGACSQHGGVAVFYR